MYWRVAVCLCVSLCFADIRSDFLGMREIPACLSGKVEQYNFQNNAPDSKRQVVVEMNAWDSNRLPALTLAILLRDVMNYDVVVEEYTGGTSTYARIANGTTHINTEVWPGNKRHLYDQYVVDEESVLDLGLIGFIGRNGWFLPHYTVEDDPGLILDYWRSLTTAGVLDIFPAAGSSEVGEAGVPDCEECEALFVPPQCEGDRMAWCKEMYHVYPTYATNVNERMIETFNLNITLNYKGRDFTDKVEEVIGAGNASLFYYWRPSRLVSKYNLKRVTFPEHTPTCYNEFDADPSTARLACDYPTERLHKIANTKVMAELPDVHALVDNFNLDDVLDFGPMMTLLSANASLTPGDVACAWAQDNEDTWSPWIPEIENLDKGLVEERTLGTCLSPAETTALRAKYGFDDFPASDKLTVEVEMNNWDSNRIVTAISALLIRDVMDYNINVREYNSGLMSYVRQSVGYTHFNVEIWPGGKEHLHKLYVREHRTVVDAGPQGYIGRVGWFFPTYMIEDHPGMLVDYWRSYTFNETRALLTPSNASEPIRDADNTTYCTYDQCDSTGRYIAAGCEGTTCPELLAAMPSWSEYVNERMIDGFDMRMNVNYLGDKHHSEVNRLYERRESFLFYWWWPDAFISSNDYTRVTFSEHTPSCYKHFNEEPAVNPLTCDYPVDLLHKIMWSGLAVSAPDVASFVQKFQIPEGEFAPLLAKTAREESETFETVACAWIKEHEDIWQAFMPEPTGAVVDCSPGTYSSNITGTCVTCRPGTYSDRKNSNQCTPCPVGNYTDNGVACIDCPAGTYAPREGTGKCTLCGVHEYLNSSEVQPATHCQRCPINQITGFKGSGSGHDCQCKDGYYAAADSVCTLCPVGAVCFGGSAQPQGLPSFWSSKDDPTLFFKCLTEEACPGGEVETCGNGYNGPLCGVCLEGYYISNYRCRQCGAGSAVLFVLVLVFIVALMVAAVLAYKYWDRLRKSARHYVQVGVVLAITVDFIQITGVLKSLSGWPGGFTFVLNSASMFNVNVELLRLPCIFGAIDFTTLYVVRAVLPVVFALPICVVIYVSPQTMKSAVIGATLFAVKFFYIPMLQNLADLFLCYRQEEMDNVWMLNAEPAIQCYSGNAWLRLLPVAILGLCGYGFGIIAFFAYVLANWRSLSQDDVFLDRFAVPMGVVNFRHHVYWWQMVILLRKFLIGFLLPAVSSQFSSTSSDNVVDVLPVSLFLLVLVCFFGVQVHIRPYKWANANWLEVLFLLALIVLLLFFAGVSSDGFDAIIIFFLLFAVTIIIVVFLTGRSVSDGHKKSRRSEPEAMRATEDEVQALVAFRDVEEASSWFRQLAQEDQAVTRYAVKLMTPRMLAGADLKTISESDDHPSVASQPLPPVVGRPSPSNPVVPGIHSRREQVPNERDESTESEVETPLSPRSKAWGGTGEAVPEPSVTSAEETPVDRITA